MEKEHAFMLEYVNRFVISTLSGQIQHTPNYKTVWFASVSEKTKHELSE